jgi:hypothetical protein
MRRREHQSGFGTTVILLVVLVVAVLAVTGVVVYRYHKPNIGKNSAATSSSQSTGQQQGTTTTQSAQVTTPYLDVKEWGIKIPLSDSIKGAYYTTAGSNKGSDGLPNTAWLGLTSLNSSGCNVDNTGPSSTATPIGSIIRVAPTDRDPVHSTPYTQLYPDGVTVKGYYYAYAAWKNKSCAPQATLQSIDAAFAKAAENTVADTTN